MKRLIEYSRDELVLALKQSVELQSHYALLLNDYDGGQRIMFGTVEAWLERLDKIGRLE
jgi:hypothetical protein